MLARKALVRCSVFALALAACGGEGAKPHAPGPAPTTAPPKPEVAETKPAADPADAPDGDEEIAEALPEVAPIDAPAVQALVDAWLAAQNADDYAAYAALYADKMEGVKRAGPRTRRFDREGWLADRKKMFDGKPMKVAIRDLAIEGSAAAPTVRFTQSFRQGRFADEGPKQLVLTRAGGGLRIAREEMLSSVLGGATATAPGAIMLVIDVNGRPHVLLADDADLEWGRGPLRGVFGSSPMLAYRSADGAPDAAAWTSKRLTVYGADGRRCDATIGALRLLGGGTPHFGEVQVWDGDPAMSPDGRKWSKAERARAVFGIGGPYLVGELKTDVGCPTAYATDAAASVAPYAAEAVDEARRAAAIAAYRALPAYAEIQRSWSGEFSRAGEWAKTIDVTSFVAGDRRVVVVRAHEGVGCGDFEGSLTALFADRGGHLELLAPPVEGGLTVDALVDSDGDGEAEIVGQPGDYSVVVAHMLPGASGFTPTAAFDFPFRDCGC